MIQPAVSRRIGGCDFAAPGRDPEDPPLAFWRAAVDPDIVSAEAARAPPHDPEAIDLGAVGLAVTVLRGGEGAEHILIADGPCRLRLELRGDSAIGGPVRLRYDIAGFTALDARAFGLQRLSALRRSGHLPRALFPADPVSIRRVRELRAWDGKCAGASQRDIAAAVLGANVMRGTRGSNRRFDSLRKQVARLIGKAGERIEDARHRFLGG